MDLVILRTCQDSNVPMLLNLDSFLPNTESTTSTEQAEQEKGQTTRHRSGTSADRRLLRLVLRMFRICQPSFVRHASCSLSFRVNFQGLPHPCLLHPILLIFIVNGTGLHLYDMIHMLPLSLIRPKFQRVHAEFVLPVSTSPTRGLVDALSA